ncbi:PREDICTED: putative F-box protein At3g49980 [Camelina sativa]|uniref:F-box protein At3g49980 n=1 Tax=Camelina sativa TaxID=90675 RepID=A0ABM0TTL9_CAMSA|nr:PREDICTED: putative F-box protein At3g49980 [Camelina sativa]
MMMSNLPDDLLEEILCRVPATSLTRLRSTCKQWNRLVNDSKFARKHNDKAAKQFLLLMVTEESRVFSLSMNLHGTPSVEATRELSLIRPEFNSNQVNINNVFHCDGLLLCTIEKDTRIVVWNPCTGQTKCIQTSDDRPYNYVLGYYQDNKSCNKSYKILGYKGYYWVIKNFKLYDISSGLWRNLDVVTPDLHILPNYPVSLKGKTYWFAEDAKEEPQLVKFLLSFDYTTERLERLRLPYQFTNYVSMALSVVREEKLSVLLQRTMTSMKEIWVTTNKIDDGTKVMSWSKLFVVEDSRRDIWRGISFMVDDEEKKAIIVCYEKRCNIQLWITTLSIVEEDNKSTQVVFPVLTELSCQPKFLVNYIPSLN